MPDPSSRTAIRDRHEGSNLVSSFNYGIVTVREDEWLIFGVLGD